MSVARMITYLSVTLLITIPPVLPAAKLTLLLFIAGATVEVVVEDVGDGDGEGECGRTRDLKMVEDLAVNFM